MRAAFLYLSLVCAAVLTEGPGGRAQTPVPGLDSPVWLDDEALGIQPADGSRSNWGGWAKRHHHPIRSLVADRDDDLSFLGRVLEGKRIVHLGESAHGVREYHAFRVRMTKYLHRDLGFDVVALESSLWDCWQAGRPSSAVDPEAAMRGCAWPVWQTEETLELFRYVARTHETTRPLTLIGFDTQPLPAPDRSAWLARIVNRFDPGLAETLELADAAFLGAYRRGGGERHVKSHGATLIDLYERARGVLRQRMDDEPAEPDVVFARQLLASNVAHVRQLGTSGAERMRVRDEGMASNLRFLLEGRYPGKRVVTWGHNFHLRRRNSQVTRAGSPLPRTMGEMLDADYGSQSYQIGMYMGQGRAALVTRKIFDIAPPGAEHGEAILMAAGRRYAFFELAGAPWAAVPLRFRWEGSVDLTFVPSAQYDALVYFHSVTPSVR